MPVGLSQGAIQPSILCPAVTDSCIQEVHNHRQKTEVSLPLLLSNSCYLRYAALDEISHIWKVQITCNNPISFYVLLYLLLLQFWGINELSTLFCC